MFAGDIYFYRERGQNPGPGTSGDDFQHEKLTEAGQADALSRKQTHKMTVYRTAVPIHTILPVMTGFLRPGPKQMIRLPGPGECYSCKPVSAAEMKKIRSVMERDCQTR